MQDKKMLFKGSLKDALSNGSGNGYGYGYGSGSVDGSGYGAGTRFGYGYDDGSGSGFGFVSGHIIFLELKQNFNAIFLNAGAEVHNE